MANEVLRNAEDINQLRLRDTSRDLHHLEELKWFNELEQFNIKEITTKSNKRSMQIK